MSQFIPVIPAEFVAPLNMNGLRGRMLRKPSTKPNKRREILLIYGQHTNLERNYAFAEVLSDYGNVTIPDLPGFGGMDSFYKINEKPDLDTFADYLASFVKLRYRNRRVTIIGFSFGFLVVTRMLQRYPELRKKVDMLVSMVGFTHRDDFTFSPMRRRMYLKSARFVEKRIPAFFFRSVFLHPSLLRKFYKNTHNAKDKFEGLDAETAKAMTEFEVHLWRTNEIRTYMAVSELFFTVDNCQQQVPLKVWHVAVPNDRYFNNENVERHLNVIFPEVQVLTLQAGKHMPILLAGKKDASEFFPRKLRTALNK